MHLEERIIVNSPAHSVFKYLLLSLQEIYCDRIVPSGIRNRLFFSNRTTRSHINPVDFVPSINASPYKLSKFEADKSICLTPRAWIDRLFVLSVSYELEELNGRTEVISRVRLPAAFLPVGNLRSEKQDLRRQMASNSTALKQNLEHRAEMISGV